MTKEQQITLDPKAEDLIFGLINQSAGLKLKMRTVKVRYDYEGVLFKKYLIIRPLNVRRNIWRNLNWTSWLHQSRKVANHQQCVLRCATSSRIEKTGIPGLLAVYIFLFSVRFVSFAQLEFPNIFFVFMREHCRIGAQPRCPVGRIVSIVAPGIL
jgi:hypothetical protein